MKDKIALDYDGYLEKYAVEFELPNRQPNIGGRDDCSLALMFQRWFEPRCQILEEAPTLLALQQLKLQLADKYMEVYSVAPLSHRNHVGLRDGHRCIFQVFMESMVRLHVLQISLSRDVILVTPTDQDALIKKTVEQAEKNRQKHAARIFGMSE